MNKLIKTLLKILLIMVLVGLIFIIVWYLRFFVGMYLTGFKHQI